MAAIKLRSLSPKRDVKKIARASGWIVGLDEVGAGCLAGPLCVAAFAYPVEFAPSLKVKTRVLDSKKLTPEERAESAEALRALPQVFHKILYVEVEEIETINIYWARMKAFWTLIHEIEKIQAETFYLVDGPRLGRKHGVTPAVDELQMMALEQRIRAQSKADDTFFAVAAASILAKVERDTFMTRFDGEFTKYGWSKNKGYATPDHIEAIRAHGMSVHHRPSFCGNFNDAASFLLGEAGENLIGLDQESA